MPDSDGADELVAGVARVAATGLGAVVEDRARQRALEQRDRAEGDRSAAAGDRARAAALTDVERAGRRRDEATAVAVVAADGRRQADVSPVDRAGWEAFDAGDGPEPPGEHPDPVRRAELAASREANRARFGPAAYQSAADVPAARDLAARNQARPATEAVTGRAPAAAATSRASKPRGRGRGPERGRGR